MTKRRLRLSCKRRSYGNPMRPRSIVEMVFVVICCIVATLFILSLVTCSTVTVITGTNGAVVSEEADKGVVIKPKKGSAE